MFVLFLPVINEMREQTKEKNNNKILKLEPNETKNSKVDLII